MSKDELNDLVIHDGGGPVSWFPEDYGFGTKELGTVYYKYHNGKNYELRPLKGNSWLLRRKVKNERGNSEYLVKWFLTIGANDKEFADMVFTKGLE